MAVIEKWEQSFQKHGFLMWLGLDKKRSGAIDTILKNLPFLTVVAGCAE